MSKIILSVTVPLKRGIFEQMPDPKRILVLDSDPTVVEEKNGSGRDTKCPDPVAQPWRKLFTVPWSRPAQHNIKLFRCNE